MPARSANKGGRGRGGGRGSSPHQATPPRNGQLFPSPAPQQAAPQGMTAQEIQVLIKKGQEESVAALGVMLQSQMMSMSKNMMASLTPTLESLNARIDKVAHPPVQEPPEMKAPTAADLQASREAQLQEAARKEQDRVNTMLQPREMNPSQ
jgi:hypothetical protein